MERDQGMRGGRGSQAFKVLLRSVSFPTRGPARLGPSQPPALLPGPACFSSRCLLPRLEEERKRGRRAWREVRSVAAESGGGASAFDVADSENVDMTGKLRSKEM